jgi:hypothetical protein
MPQDGDPRLGPYTTLQRSLSGLLPEFTYDLDPPSSTLSLGGVVTVEFRGASQLAHDTPQERNNWWPLFDQFRSGGWQDNFTDQWNFPNDPLKAGDAHIRNYDARQFRDWWVYMYNENITSYTPDLNELMDRDFTTQFSSPKKPLEPRDIEYFNWRFIMKANVDSTVALTLDSFAISYRFPNR